MCGGGPEPALSDRDGTRPAEPSPAVFFAIQSARGLTPVSAATRQPAEEHIDQRENNRSHESGAE
jgi:hypothetical protein